MFPIMVSVRLELTLLSKTELPVEVGVKGSVVSKEVNNIKIILYKLEVSFFDIETKSETVFGFTGTLYRPPKTRLQRCNWHIQRSFVSRSH